MANYHSDEWIMERVHEHWLEALTLFPKDRIVGIFLQGSQNYGLDYEGSDIDTKLIVVPTWEDICFNRKPVSTTHIRANDEHIDLKDIRLMFQTFRKQNLNFMEILFTKYKIINPMYEEQWNRLIAAREQIARMNPYRAVKSMKGIAMEKYHAMEHRYPSKAAIIDAYGYDDKQVSHLIRVYNYLRRYICGESYESCLRPSSDIVPRIMDYKALSKISLAEARVEAAEYKHITEVLADAYCFDREEKEDPEMRPLLEDVSYNIMRISVEKELLK